MIREFGGSRRLGVSGIVVRSPLHSIFRGSGGAAGAPSTHVDGSLRFREPDISFPARKFVVRRFGALTVRGKCPARAGMALFRANYSSFQLSQESFAQAGKPVPATPTFWALRQRPQSLEEIRVRQRELEILRCSAIILWPDICASLAKLAARANPLYDSDIYRISDLVETERGWQQVTVSRYASTHHSASPARGDVDGRMRARGEKAHCGTRTSAGRRDAAYRG